MIRYWEEDTDTEIGRPFDLEKHDKEISDKCLDKVKKAREEIKKLHIEKPEKFWELGRNEMNMQVLEILDKLIESEVE